MELGRGFLRWAPKAAGVFVAGSLVHLLWLAPAQVGESEWTVWHEETQVIEWGAYASHRTHLVFEYNVTLPGKNARLYEVVPGLQHGYGFSINRLEGGPRAVYDWINLSVNGEPVSSAHNNNRDGVNFTNFLGIPGSRDAMRRQDLFHPGVNTIRYDVDVVHEGEPWRKGMLTATYGPIRTTIHLVDRDGDGIPDAHQPVPGVYTPLVALSAALAGFIGTHVGVQALQSRWVRPRDGPP